MDTIQKGLTTLLRSAITGEALPLPEEFRLEDAMGMIRRHSIVTLVYEGAVHCGIDRKTAAMQQLFQSYCKLLMQSEAQGQAIDRLFAAFDQNGIDYLPLKGCSMKALYPRPELRLMGDADVLIREKQYPQKIKPLLETLGYSFLKESVHEIVWTSRPLYLELHKNLTPAHHKVQLNYFRDSWSMAIRKTENRYVMSPEDTLLFQFAHFVRHYIDSGIGCRHVVDLWVYIRSNPDLDQEKLHRELEKLGLSAFYENICRMIAVWFEEKDSDPKIDFLTASIFESGSWGTELNQALSLGLRRQQISTRATESRFFYLFRIVFPKRISLLRDYPVLNRYPWLLPWIWLVRLCRKVLSGTIQFDAHRRNLKLFTQENLDRKRASLEFVGLRDQN